MNEERIATYLNDHLAGSVMAMEMIENSIEHNRDTPVAAFLVDLLKELREDQQVLKGLIFRYGAEESSAKKVSAWVAEKASRLKISGGGHYSSLSLLQEMEMLLLGIRGKLAMWVALESLADVDPRLQGRDFQALQERAKRQMEVVEERRLEAVRHAFRGG